MYRLLNLIDMKTFMAKEISKRFSEDRSLSLVTIPWSSHVWLHLSLLYKQTPYFFLWEFFIPGLHVVQRNMGPSGRAFTRGPNDEVHVPRHGGGSNILCPGFVEHTSIYVKLHWCKRWPGLRYIYPLILGHITNWGIQSIIVSCISNEHCYLAFMIYRVCVSPWVNIISTGIKDESNSCRLPLQPVGKRRSGDTHFWDMETFVKVSAEINFLIHPI